MYQMMRNKSTDMTGLALKFMAACDSGNMDEIISAANAVCSLADEVRAMAKMQIISDKTGLTGMIGKENLPRAYERIKTSGHDVEEIMEALADPDVSVAEFKKTLGVPFSYDLAGITEEDFNEGMKQFMSVLEKEEAAKMAAEDMIAHGMCSLDDLVCGFILSGLTAEELIKKINIF